MQRGIERAVLHLEEFIRSPLNVLPDLVTVSRSIEKGSQDAHVKRSLEEPDPLLRFLGHRRQSTPDLGKDGRHSTIDCQREKAGRGFSNDDFRPKRSLNLLYVGP